MNTSTPRKRQPNVCLRCSSSDCTVRHFDDIVDFKGLTLEVGSLAETVCNACQHRWTTDGQESDNLAILRDAFATRRDAIRAEQGLLTGPEVERALALLSLTRAEAAELFGGGPNAFARYVSGDVLQSFAMDRLIRLSVAFGDPALQVLRRGAKQPLELYSSNEHLHVVRIAVNGRAEPNAVIASATPNTTLVMA